MPSCSDVRLRQALQITAAIWNESTHKTVLKHGQGQFSDNQPRPHQQEDHIWKNRQGERCISTNLVENRKTWDNGDETWGFMPSGGRIKSEVKHPILGNAKKFEKRPEQAPQQQPEDPGSPF